MKYILRKSFENDLPKEIIDRPKKTFQVGCNSSFIKDEPYKSIISSTYENLFVNSFTIEPIDEVKSDEVDDMMEIINSYPKILPHLYKQKFKLIDRIKQGRVLYDGNCIIIFRKYKRSTKISLNSNVVVNRGDFTLNQIISNRIFRGGSERMLNQFIEFCKDNGGENIFLSVRRDNLVAIKFYKRNGFKFIDKTYWKEQGKKLHGEIFSLQLKSN